MQTRRIGTFIAALALVGTLPGASQGQFAVTRLADGHQPLQEDFNARKGRPRLITVWSPT